MNGKKMIEMTKSRRDSDLILGYTGDLGNLWIQPSGRGASPAAWELQSEGPQRRT
jgi:hypothetical protein